MRIFKNVRKIAILRANALGDFIFTLPAIKAIKNRFPQSEIVLLGKQWHKEFLMNRRSDIDRVEVVPKYPGVGEPEDYKPNEKELNSFFLKMRREKFDLAFQLHGGGKNSNPFIKRLNAKINLGLKTDDAEPLDISLSYIYFQHEVLRYLEVAALAGADPADITPTLNPSPGDIANTRKYLGKRNQRLAILHPGASDPRRRWPLDKFAKTGNELAKNGCQVIITGNKEEENITTELQNMLPAKTLNLAGLLDLGGLVGLISQTDVLVSNDTGPLHLAMAMGTPSVGIYWCGNMINAGPFFRRRNRPLISWKLTCSQCGKHIIYQGIKNCQHMESFVSDVKSEDAINASLELLSLRETVKSKWLSS